MDGYTAFTSGATAEQVSACAKAIAAASQGSFWLGLCAGVLALIVIRHIRDRWS